MMARTRRRAIHLATRLAVASTVEQRRDARRVARILAVPAPGGQRAEHLLVVPPANGNIGDQALFEAFLEGTSGDVVVVVTGPTDVTVPDWASERVRVVTLPDLVYGTGRPHRAAVDRFARLARLAEHVTIVGADVMDGRYSLRASVNRSSLAAALAGAGTDTRVLGFSWNGHARAAARAALLRADRAGVRLLARDPVSLDRLRATGVVGATGVADIVFTATRLAEPDLEITSSGRPLVLLNVSGLLARTVDQVADAVAVAEHLRAAGRHVVLIPHVSRPKGDDIEVIRDVAACLGTEHVTALTTLLAPAQIRSLVARADAVVSGRMHLAVIALSQGVPALVLASQGKVEGLMALFGTPERCIDPATGWNATAIPLLDGVLGDLEAERARILDALPGVTALAHGNLVGLAPLGSVVP